MFKGKTDSAASTVQPNVSGLFTFPFPSINTYHPIEREISYPTRRRLPLRKPERERSLHDGQGQERRWTRRKYPQQRCLNPQFCSISSSNIVVTLVKCNASQRITLSHRIVLWRTRRTFRPNNLAITATFVQQWNRLR